MAHYPIKCVRCTHVSRNSEVLFDVEDSVGNARAVLEEENSQFTVGGKTASTHSNEEKAGKQRRAKSIWDTTDTEDESTDSTTQSDKIIKGRLMTFGMMQEYCAQEGLGAVTPIWTKVNVTPDFAGKDIDDPTSDLLTGMTFNNEKGRVVRAAKRYCPACRCELPAQSGAMPTYAVTVMGTSASGKTVYLCALNWLLSNKGGGTLPYNSKIYCVSASKNGNMINKLSAELFSRGVLPGTTQIVLTEPLVFQITYQLKDRMKTCLLALSDMRGEDLASDDGENLMLRNEFFSRADGFMLIISPMNIPAFSRYFQNNSGAETSASVHLSLIHNINDYILPYLPNRKVTVPSVIMLSKCDLLMSKANEMNIPRYNPVVAPEAPIRFTGTYFKNQYVGTRQIVSADNALHGFISTSMNDPYFTSFSSLGANAQVNVEDEGSRKVSNYNLMNPLRVMDPIIYLLIQFGFLPAFQKMEAGENYEKANTAILSEWIQSHT